MNLKSFPRKVQASMELNQKFTFDNCVFILCVSMTKRCIMKISFLNLIMKKICPLHTDIYLIHTETPDGTIKDYCPRCQKLFGEKI